MVIQTLEFAIKANHTCVNTATVMTQWAIATCLLHTLVKTELRD